MYKGERVEMKRVQPEDNVILRAITPIHAAQTTGGRCHVKT